MQMRLWSSVEEQFEAEVMIGEGRYAYAYNLLGRQSYTR